MTDTHLPGARATRPDELLADLEALVRCESPSSDVSAVQRCAELIAALAQRYDCGPVMSANENGRPVLRVGPPRAPVLLLAHLDTVHPLGSLARNPWRIADGRAYGPGIFDMKSGIVIALDALAATANIGGATLLITSDEEVGSPCSRAVIEQAAVGTSAVLVLEPSHDGALKTSRKSVSNYELRFHGRAAHAGLEPERGANACLALAKTAIVVSMLSDLPQGTTVTPTVAAAGSASNVVPESATLHVDVRAATAADQARVDRELRALASPVDDVSIEVLGGPNRPPLEPSASGDLFELAQTVAARLGMPELRGAAVGGGSDGNFTAALGIPTLDGLGPVGGGAHALDEWVEIASLRERAALLAGIIREMAPVPAKGGG